MEHIGKVYQFDVQMDVFRRSYRVVAHVEGNTYEVEYLPLTDEALAEMEADEYMSDAMILEEIDRTGYRARMRFVSRDEYARHF